MSGTGEFATESNMIEGLGTATEEEVFALENFIHAVPTLESLKKYVSVIQPNAVFRDTIGLDVQIGNHTPISGGPKVSEELDKVLLIKDLYYQHLRYELLHPFTDGNGRSGRALWLNRMYNSRMTRRLPMISFLHMFYYQTLNDLQKGD